MRSRLTAAALILLVAIVSRSAVAQQQVRVYVAESGADGFTAGPGAADSTKDLIKAIAKKKNLTLVESEQQADVVVQVKSRHEEKSTTGYTTRTNETKERKNNKDRKEITSTSQANEDTLKIVLATLAVGKYKVDLEGKSSFGWSIAAGKLADQIEKWSEDNYSRLLERRAANRSASAPQTASAPTGDAQTASPSSQSASIQPGMTAEQITAAMGPPLKKVTFGNKELWEYRGMQVVFQDGKVTDVKF